MIALCAKKAFTILTINVGVARSQLTKRSPPTLNHSIRVALYKMMAVEELQNASFGEVLDEAALDIRAAPSRYGRGSYFVGRP